MDAIAKELQRVADRVVKKKLDAAARKRARRKELAKLERAMGKRVFFVLRKKRIAADWVAVDMVEQTLIQYLKG